MTIEIPELPDQAVEWFTWELNRDGWYLRDRVTKILKAYIYQNFKEGLWRWTVHSPDGLSTIEGKRFTLLLAKIAAEKCVFNL